MMSVEALKRKIEALGSSPQFTPRRWQSGAAPWQFGVPEMDAALPAGRLTLGAVHEIAGKTPTDSLAAAGFMLALIARLPQPDQGAGKPVLWCQSPNSTREYGAFYGAGLSAFGLPPGRLLIVHAAQDRDIPWCLEEGVRAARLGAVVGEGGGLSFTATRRLSLACAETATPCLYLDLTGRSRASAASTRWQISPAGQADREDPLGPGCLGWQVSLTRARGGRPGNWHVMWNHETHSFDLAARFRDGALPHRRAEGRASARLQRTG